MKKILSVMIALAMVAAMAVMVCADEEPIKLEKVVVSEDSVLWYFSGLIVEPRYEAGWNLADDEGNFYVVGGWAWDDSTGKTVLSTTCADNDVAYAKAGEGKLVASIIDVTDEQENGVVDASDSPTKIVGADGKTAVVEETIYWGAKEGASATCITPEQDKVEDTTVEETEDPAADTKADAKADDETKAAEEKKGCGSIVSASAAILAVVLAAPIVLRKKEH